MIKKKMDEVEEEEERNVMGKMIIMLIRIGL